MFVGELIASFFFIGLGVYVFFTSLYVFPGASGRIPGPGFFPGILATLLVVLGICQMISVLRNSAKLRVFSEFLPNWRNVAIMLLFLISYYILLSVIGFIPSTILFLLGLMVWLKERNWAKIITISIGISLAVFTIFSKLLNVTLPGVW